MPRDRYEDDDDDRPRRRRDDDDEDNRPRRRRRDEDDDDDDRPRRSRRRRDYEDRPAPPQGNGLAMGSLVLGILSICFGPITGIIGGVLGVMGMGKPSGKGMAITGMILSGLFSVVWVGLIVWGFTVIPQTAGKKRMELNGKMLGIAGHNNFDVNASAYPYVRRPGEFAGQVPPDLNDRLSWRVSLLPYLEEELLYRRFDQTQPWNGGPNQPLSTIAVTKYTDSDTPTDPATRFRCFYDNGAAFDSRNPTHLPGSFTDGTSNTFLYVEGGDKVTWSRFQEYKFDPRGSLPPLGHPNRDVFLVVMADGSTRWVKKSTDPEVLKGMITRNGGEVVSLDR